jgi:hypothetical protein
VSILARNEDRCTEKLDDMLINDLPGIGCQLISFDHIWLPTQELLDLLALLQHAISGEAAGQDTKCAAGHCLG